MPLLVREYPHHDVHTRQSVLRTHSQEKPRTKSKRRHRTTHIFPDKRRKSSSGGGDSVDAGGLYFSLKFALLRCFGLRSGPPVLAVYFAPKSDLTQPRPPALVRRVHWRLREECGNTAALSGNERRGGLAASAAKARQVMSATQFYRRGTGVGRKIVEEEKKQVSKRAQKKSAQPSRVLVFRLESPFTRRKEIGLSKKRGQQRSGSIPVRKTSLNSRPFAWCMVIIWTRGVN